MSRRTRLWSSAHRRVGAPTPRLPRLWAGPLPGGAVAVRTMAWSSAAHSRRCGRPRSRGDADRVQDLLIAGAPAQVAGERLADFGVGWMWILAQQADRLHDKARRAKTALHRAGLSERELHRVQRAAVGEAFDREDLAVLRLARRDEAGAHGHAVHEHGTGAAFTLLARVLAARQTEPLTQQVEQAFSLPYVVGDPVFAIDSEADPHRGSPSPSPQPILEFAPCPDQRAPRHHREREPPVARGTAHVVDGVAGGGHKLAEPRYRRVTEIAWVFPQAPFDEHPLEKRLRGRRATRRWGRGADAGSHPPRWRVQLQAERGDRDDHRVAWSDLAKLLRPRRRGHEHAGDELPRAQGVALHSREEVADGDLPRPVRRHSLDHRARCEQQRVHVPGR